MAKLVLKQEQIFNFQAVVTEVTENNNEFNNELIESYRLKFDAFGGNVPTVTPTKYKGSKFVVSGQISRKPFQQKRFVNGEELLDARGANILQLRDATAYLGEEVTVSGAVSYYVAAEGGEVRPTLKITSIQPVGKRTIIAPMIETELRIFPSLESAMSICDVVESVPTEGAKTPLEIFSGLTLLELQKLKLEGGLDAYLTQKGKDTMTSADEVKGFKKLAEAI